MLKRIFSSISNLLSSLFGNRRNQTTTPVHPTVPDSNARRPDLIEDSSDVPRDTIITVNEKNLEIIGPAGPTSPTFADKDKESAFDQPQTSQPAPNPQPTPTPTPTLQEAPKSAPSGNQAEPPSKNTPRYLWCLDNGHGKLQPGKRSPVFEDEKGNQVQFFEYEFNRDVVERIMKALDKHGVKYLDVVPDYLEVGSFLPERVERANSKQSSLPKIFVSVHANAGPTATPNDWVAPSVKGVETWYAHNSRRGQKIAAVFQRHLVDKTGLRNRNLKSTAEKPLYVLEKTTMPAILTECGFYNNREEVKELMKPSMRQKIADAHVEAILEIEKNGI